MIFPGVSGASAINQFICETFILLLSGRMSSPMMFALPRITTSPIFNYRELFTPTNHNHLIMTTFTRTEAETVAGRCFHPSNECGSSPLRLIRAVNKKCYENTINKPYLTTFYRSELSGDETALRVVVHVWRSTGRAEKWLLTSMFRAPSEGEPFAWSLRVMNFAFSVMTNRDVRGTSNDSKTERLAFAFFHSDFDSKLRMILASLGGTASSPLLFSTFFSLDS